MSKISGALHYLFELSLLAKGTLALTESLSGLGLLLTPNAAITAVVAWLAQLQMTEASAERLAAASGHFLAVLSLQSQHFYALYLMGHGALKLAMVLALARRWPAAYPVSMALLAGFVAYQFYEFSQGGSPVLGLMAALDTMMIALVAREYRLLVPQPATSA